MERITLFRIAVFSEKKKDTYFVSRQQRIEIIVKLRQGSGKDRQGMAVKVKGLKALSLAKSLH